MGGDEIVSERLRLLAEYARIDDAKVYSILKKRLGDFDAFARAIVDYLEPHTEAKGSESEARVP